MDKRVGVYICHCGSNIAGYLDCQKVTEFAQSLDSVVIARDYSFMCSDPGQDFIKNDIQELGRFVLVHDENICAGGIITAVN